AAAYISSLRREYVTPRCRKGGPQEQTNLSAIERMNTLGDVRELSSGGISHKPHHVVDVTEDQAGKGKRRPTQNDIIKAAPAERQQQRCNTVKPNNRQG